MLPWSGAGDREADVCTGGCRFESHFAQVDPDVPLGWRLAIRIECVSFLVLFCFVCFVLGLSEVCLLLPDQLVVFPEVRLHSHGAPDLSASEDVAKY